MTVDESYYDELHAVACRVQAAALDRIKGAGARVWRDAGFGPEMTADDRAVLQLDDAAQTVAGVYVAQVCAVETPRGSIKPTGAPGASGSYNAVKAGALQGQKGGFDSRGRLFRAGVRLDNAGRPQT